MADAPSFEDIVQNATGFPWNARRLLTRLSDFQYWMFKHQFTILAISKSRGAPGFFLSSYELFQSHRNSDVIRVLLALRKHLNYISHSISTHPNNEYVCVTARNRVTFSVITTYISPFPFAILMLHGWMISSENVDHLFLLLATSIPIILLGLA